MIVIELDDITMKTKLVFRDGIIAKRFDEKTFFSIILCFTPHWGYKHYNEYISQKVVNLSTTNKIHLKSCLCFFRPGRIGETYYNLLKLLEKKGNKGPIQIITRSPNEYPNCTTSNEIKPIDKYEGSVVIFDDMLGTRNSS